MERIYTLLDRQEASGEAVLPEELRALYGGDLRFPAPRERPYVFTNFVATLDGVVGYDIPGKSGGGPISGFDEADRFIMGLLRASADAVMVGAGTLRDVAPRHLFVAEHVYPAARDLYARYRRDVLKKPNTPLNVIVSGSGQVDLDRAVFHTPELRTLIITSEAGKERLAKSGVEVRAVPAPGGAMAPEAILNVLHAEFDVSLVLHEGGPRLLGDFVAHGAVDELFLTMAPQLAGRGEEHPRPGLIAGKAFLPETAPWLDLVSVKQQGSHLYLRYRRTERRA